MQEVKKPKKPLIYYYIIVIAIVVLFNLLVMPALMEMRIKEVDYRTFMKMTEDKSIGLVEIQSNQIVFTDKEQKQVYKTGIIDDPGRTERLYAAGVTFSAEIIEEKSVFASLLGWILPIVIFFVIGQFFTKRIMNKKGGPNAMSFNMGKSNAKIYVKSSNGISFDDVEGVDEAKESLTEIVDYLHDPSKYKEIGATMPKGVLLVGPPGTGKTMLAKAVAGEANVPFFSISGSEFVEMFVGMGARAKFVIFLSRQRKNLLASCS